MDVKPKRLNRLKRPKRLALTLRASEFMKRVEKYFTVIPAQAGIQYAKLFFILILLLFLPRFCFACTPIFVGVYFMGPAILGSMLLSALGVLLAVVIKIVVFLFLSDYKSPHVIWMMLLANIVSTGFGICISVATINFLFLLLSPAIGYAFFLIVAHHINRHGLIKTNKRINIAGIMTVWFVLIIVLFIATLAVIGQGHVLYWIFKIILSILAVGLTLLFSVVLEEAVIAAMYKKVTKDTSDKNFLRPVLWANIIAFFIVFGLAAAKSLPTRLHTPGFLNPGWWQ